MFHLTNKKKASIWYLASIGVLLLALTATLLCIPTGSVENKPLPTSSTEASTAPSYATGSQSTNTVSTALTTVTTTVVHTASTTYSASFSTSKNTSAAATSSATSSSSADPRCVEVLQDPTFQNGFRALGLSVSDGGMERKTVFNPLNTNKRQYWDLASWNSRYAFGDVQYTTQQDLGNGVYKYINPTKEFTVDTKNAVLTFTGIATACYDEHRTGSEPWLHLTIGQSSRTADTRIAELERLDITLSNRLLAFEDHMGDAFKINNHTAQFSLNLMVRNIDTASPDYNQFIWLCIHLFDNRWEWCEPGTMLDVGTQSLMVFTGNRVLYKENKQNNCWKNGRINASLDAKWSHFSWDALPTICNALIKAQKDGYLLHTSLEQLAVTGLNIGWEIPGTYNATMQIKDFSILATKKGD